jgi:glutamate formiminotransferase
VSAPDLVSAVNVSEGKDAATVDLLAEACGEPLLDVHRDADHHRSVLTMAGSPGALERSLHTLLELAVELLDLTTHAGAHPRFGVVDVVPFAPVAGPDLTVAQAARDRLAVWAGATLRVPCFLYGPMPDGGTRSLPEVRRGAFITLQPDTGPDRASARSGAMAIGARGPMVAYNLWVRGLSAADTRAVAARVRGPALRALGLTVGEFTQVSCNLVDPGTLGPADAYDLVLAALPRSADIVRAELVGLAPQAVLDATPPERWVELGLSAADGLEARMDEPALRKRRS